jgi:hypothetical protein
MDTNNPHNKNTRSSKQNEGGIGPIIGTLIIVVLLIATALYIWGEHLDTVAQIQQANQNIATSTTTIIYSTSTEPSDIQNDLQANPTIKNPGF